MLGKLSRAALFLIPLFLLIGLYAPDTQAQPAMTLILKVDGSINPVSSRFLKNGIEAAGIDTRLIVIELNTPGGGDRSMREIIQAMLLSPVPVCVFVYPPGSRAASAGTYIAYASAIAAMAPGTNIGAAHPVTLGGQADDVMMEKITNDAVALIISLAEKTGRNDVWAEQAVRQSVAISAEQAKSENVVNVLASDLPDLLNQLEGVTVRVGGTSLVLHDLSGSIEEHSMSWWDRFLEEISDPNIAYILLLIGIYALIAEVFHPTVVAGVMGAIALLLASFALEVLSVNLVGLLMILVAVILFILEIKVPGFGILGVGGIVAFVLGSLMLFGQSGFTPSFSTGLSLWIIIVVAILSLVFFFVVIAAALRARSRPSVPMEMDALLGSIGIVQSDLNPNGMIQAQGSYWRAKSLSGRIQTGQRVKVMDKKGMELLVKKEEEE